MQLAGQPVSLSPWRRQWAIGKVMSLFLAFLIFDCLTGGLKSPRQRQRRARWLVAQMLKLGPTFIKIAQAFSTRADLIPREYTLVFSELQDRVPPFPTLDAIAVIETELSQPLNSLFQNFREEPIASASLGQVYRAQLTTGDAVVVKVQRPRLEALFRLDFLLLHRQLRFLQRWVPGIQTQRLEEIYQEFFGLLFEEVDYLREGENADRFRENFRGDSRILVPKVYWQYSSRRVLTLEYVPGIKISDRKRIVSCGLNPDRIIQLGVCTFLKQLLEDGFFQSDPHPGNLAVSLNGELIFYDFGTMTRLNGIAQEQMLQVFWAVLAKDVSQVVQLLTHMGLVEKQSDMGPVRNLVAFLIERFLERPVDISELEQLGDELYRLFKQQPFRLPREMMFVIKSLTTLDGVARTLNPQYNMLAASQPYIREVAFSNNPQTLARLLRRMARQTKIWLTRKYSQSKLRRII